MYIQMKNVYYFIMNGKSTIKIMSKTQLIHTLKFGNFQTDIKVQSFKKYSTKKRASSPLVSTSISTQRKNNNQSSLVKKLPKNNFLTASNNLFSVMSCKRLSQCQTAMALRAVKKEDPLIKTQAQKLLLKNSDKIQKLLWNELNQNLPPLIISADFILDQDLFWSQPKINPLIIKNWKQLHKKYFVVWIIKQLKSLKKLKDFTQSNQLPLNSVYYHKRQPKYTIDYSPLRKQINKVYGSELKQIRAIQCLKLNTKDICQSGTFFGRTPLMFDPRFKVYYIRNDQSGFGIQKIVQICKILSTSENKITQLKSIQVFIENQYKKIKSQKQYINNEHSKMITIIDRTQTQFVDQQDAQKEVDKFKRKLIDTIIRQNGRNFQVQGFSTHYFIGDIIKRNYQLLLKNAMKRLKNKQKVLPKLQSQKKQNKIEYKHNQLGIVQKYYQFY